jgi:hypothetical protein
MKEQNWALIVERVLKLAIPTLYIWLVMFYTLFHVWLNILAEVLRFGDREFYKVSLVVLMLCITGYEGSASSGCVARTASSV